MTELKNENRYGAIDPGKHAGERQSVATIIPFAAKNDERVGEELIFFYPFCTSGCRPFHQVNRSDRLMFNGKLVPLLYFCSRKYFHNANLNLKVGKQSSKKK